MLALPPGIPPLQHGARVGSECQAEATQAEALAPAINPL